MSESTADLTASELATIAYETGLTDGQINSVNNWDWLSSTELSPLYSTSLSSASKWGDAEVGTAGTVTYAFDPGSGFTAAQEATYVASMTLWSDETNIKFVEATNPAQADVTFSLIGSSSPGVPLDGGAFEFSYHSTGEAGSSTLPVNVSAILAINTSGFGNLSSFSDQGGYSITTVVHELGHLIGLGHTGSYNGDVNASVQQYNPTDNRLWSVMSYIPPTDATAKYYSDYSTTGADWGTATASSTPQMLDILAAQELYGTPTETAYSGGQIFGFNCNITDASRMFFDFTVNTNPIVTIWDAGTDNTLDLSGFYTPSIVNLNAGSFSSVDGMTDNIAIAYNTAIDTLIGGYGNDTITVNGDSDTIDGGGGTNTVIFANAMANYRISRESDGTIIVNYGSVSDTLKNIQTLQFLDQTVSASSIPEGQTVYSWAGGDASFDTAINWIDEATGQTADVAPGAGDIAVINGPTSGGPETILGDGTARQIIFTGLNGIVGDLSATLLTVGQGADPLESLTIAPGATISVASAALVDGTLRDQGLLDVSAALTVAPDEAASTVLLSIQNGGTVQAGSLILQNGSVSIDNTSFLDIGTVAAPTAGLVQIGTDGTLAGSGVFGFSIGGNNNPIIDNGLIIAEGGTLALPTVVGTGRVQIGAGSNLALLGTAAGTASVTFTFLDATGVLSITGSSSAALGTITNFVAGDAIVLGATTTPLLQPQFESGDNGDGGVLTVEDVNGTPVFSATLQGAYSNNVFFLLPVSGGGYEIETAQGSLSGSTTPSAGTSGSGFAWSSATSGDWNDATNWAVLSASSAAQTAATVTPGAQDDVVIGSPGQPNTLIISGDGNADELTVLGSEAFSGAVTVTAFEDGLIGDGAGLALIGSASLRVATIATVTDSQLDVANGTTFTVGSTLILSASSSLSASTLAVYGGGQVQVGGLVLAGGDTSIAVDSASSFEVGTAGNAKSGGITVDAGYTFSGYGTLAAVTVYNYGTVIASGGTLALRTAAGPGNYDITSNATLSVLQVPSVQNALPIFDFGGTNATLMLSLAVLSSSYTYGTVKDFAYGNVINFAATLAAQPTQVTYTSIGTDVGTLALASSGGVEATLNILGNYQQSDFILGQTGAGVVSLSIACFAGGTRILTETGEARVESLAVGDQVMTIRGEVTPVIWIGHRRVDCRNHPRPEAVMPVLVTRHAFGLGLPARDLYLSPDHAIYIDGVLIPVKHLINGTSVVQEDVDHVTYWHVELAQHDVILAEGLPAESYLDSGDRAAFANGGALAELHPAWGSAARDVSLTMDALGYAPLCVTGPKLDGVRARLEAQVPQTPRRAKRAA